ncbi:MAG: hypothetical protein A2Y67_01215 [Candidatus Buchananbacteria bacterium RBG_13_39_9]|uniref:DDH domain-containing protein n=1 Tax=Candidatus Buchananbacteria bacterium RBG_13_39_9 TaxID=1797531 RepID=A0A1G1XMY1_9BACT|nr:MAG: hypothetical protein A2Y67_01215 [Candidatus Buchananbacteria bacterium RBG_13_39_9]
MQFKQIIPQILDKIKKAAYPLIISHENPDGDTLGASLALANFLDKEKINHQHFCIDKPAPYFSFLPKIEKLITDYRLINLARHDLVLAIDCGSLARTGISSDLQKIKDKTSLINIDHHQSNDHFGHYNLVQPQTSSTSEIVYNFFQHNKIAIDKYIATNLLTGILSDTMNFTNASTTDDSLKIASNLLKVGARVNQITSSLTQNKDLNSLKLWGKILSRLSFVPEDNFAFTYISQKDLSENQIEADKIDGLANFLTALEDVDFILVLTEEADGTIKGNLRTTKDNIDVAKLAQGFNGGGHQKAAGFKIKNQTSLSATALPETVINDIINQIKMLKRNNL